MVVVPVLLLFTIVRTGRIETMTTTCENLGIERVGMMLRFEWGPNEYVVKRNFAGNIVWKRWNAHSGWWKRVDLTARHDSKFSTLLLACVEQIMCEG
jgi:hypothetical protein